ncbi:YncE family protein [Micromonospora pallida]|uniref:YncE family protein n=1 Tax=Micromonospora pallida TaxID=145854 RepID=UPI000B8A5F3F|nr:hypothetical protein [Micromonospora pallida]
MRSKLIARLMVAVLGAASAVVAPFGSGVAHARTAVELGMASYRDMVVDAAHARLFFSPGRNSTAVRVTDLSGGSQTTIPGLAGATGMALSPDGSTLYVALVEAHAIAAIDTTTLTETRRYSTGSSTCPTWLTHVGGKLYFGYGCRTGEGRLGSLDLRGETPVLATKLPVDGMLVGPPMLAGSPGNPDLLLATDEDAARYSLPGKPTLYDVSSGTPSIVATVPSETCTSLNDAVVTPDATRVILACSRLYGESGWATEHAALSTTDLSPAGRFPSAVSPTAVTTSRDGSFVILGSTSTIFVERPDGSLVRRYHLPPDSALIWHGLATGGDGTLYAITRNPDAVNEPILQVFTDFVKENSSVALSAPSTSTRGGKLTVTGRLTFTGAALSTPQTVRVVKRDLAGTHTLPSVTTTSTGMFSFSDTPLIGGANTYEVSFAGDAGHAGSSGFGTVQVSRAVTALNLTVSKTTTSTGRTATVTAQLGTTYNSRTVCLYAQPSGATQTPLACGPVNSSGRLVVSYPISRMTTFSARFAGDYRYAPASVSRLVYP